MGNENERTKEKKDLHLRAVGRARRARREADDEPSLELVHFSGSGLSLSLSLSGLPGRSYTLRRMHLFHLVKSGIFGAASESQ